MSGPIQHNTTYASAPIAQTVYLKIRAGPPNWERWTPTDERPSSASNILFSCVFHHLATSFCAHDMSLVSRRLRRGQTRSGQADLRLY